MTEKKSIPTPDRFLSPAVLLLRLHADLARARDACLSAKVAYYEIATTFKLSDRRGEWEAHPEGGLAKARKIYTQAIAECNKLGWRIASASKRPRPEVPLAISRLIATENLCADRCIEWEGALGRNGYGMTYYRGSQHLAHRVSYAVHNKVDLADIAGLEVRHKCDNPPCINPLHLLPGTHLDNMRDMRDRGRARKGPGSNMPGAKLTEQDVPIIRAQLAAGVPRKEIASSFNITKGQVSRIGRRASWIHV